MSKYEIKITYVDCIQKKYKILMMIITFSTSFSVVTSFFSEDLSI